MGQRIGAGSRGELRGRPTVNSGSRITSLASSSGVEQNRFAAGRIQGNDGTAADLAARPGSGRDGDERRQAGPVGFVIKPRQLQLGPLHQEPGRLAGVQRAAAADRDHRVALVGAKRGGRFADVRFHRVRMDPG